MKSILNLAFLALATTAWHSPTAASGASLPLLDAEEIVFIDAGVEDAGELAGAVCPGIEAVVLDACQDPVAQMARILSARGGLSVVHLVSHGQPGALILNGRVVKAEMLLESDFVDAVNLSLRDAGELRLYGCEVAAGSRGAHFFREIAGALQGRLSASTDRTGNSRLGGDWELEASAGKAQAGHPFRDGFEYRGLLPPVYTVTNPNMNYYTRPGGSNFYWQYGSYASATPSPAPITRVGFSSRSGPDTPRGTIQYATSIAGPWTTITVPVGSYSSSISVSGRIFRFVDSLPSDTTSTITGDTSFEFQGGASSVFTNAFYTPDNLPTDVYPATLDYWGTPSAAQVVAKMRNTDTGAPFSFGAAYTIDSQSVTNLFDISGENLVKGSGSLPAVGVGTTVTLRYRDYFQLDDNGVPISGQGITRTVTMTRRENPAGFGNDLKANTFTANAQNNSQVAGLSDGSYVVIWRSAAQGNDTGTNGGIYGQKYTSAGVASGGEFAISPTGSDKNESNPSITALPNGRFVVAYQQANANTDAMFRIVEANGTLGAESSASSVTTGNQTTPAVTALSDGNFAIAWIGPNGGDSADIWVRKFDASTGAGVSGSELVVSAQTGNQSLPGVAGLSDGNYAVSWRDPASNGDAYCRVMGSSAAVSSQISVNVGTSSMTNPRIAALTGGGFVIVYSEAGRTEEAFTDSSSESNIYGKRYNNEGTLQGTEFLVNGGFVSSQTSPAISRLSGGGFVVAWQSNTDPDDSLGVFGRRFDSTATPVDSHEFQLNQQRTGVQNFSSLGGLSANNSFAAAWTDNTLDTGDASSGVGTRLFTGSAPAGDTTAPFFDVAPATANITASGFDLSASIDEGGTIFYVVVADAATAPTSAQVVAGQNGSSTAALASGSQAVATTPFSHTFTVSSLSAGTAYDVYVVARDDEGTPNLQATPQKVDVSTLSNNADLSGLALTTATINETFAANTTSYTSTVPNATSSVTVTATRAQANATIEARVGANAFATITSGSASPSLLLAEGANTINVRVTAQDGSTQKTYTITVTRAAASSPTPTLLGTPVQQFTISSTLSYTVAAGTERLLVVTAGDPGSPTNPTSVTFNGMPMSLGNSTSDNQFSCDSIWYLALGSGASITGNIQVSFGGTASRYIGAAAYSTVNQTTPVDTNGPKISGSVSNDPTVSSSLDVTSQTGDLVFDLVDVYHNNATPGTNAGEGQTVVNNVGNIWSAGASRYTTSIKAGAPSVQMSWTTTNTQGFGAIAILHLTMNINVGSGAGATAPVVTTATQTSVTASSATLGGNVTADGGASVTERGIVWGTATGPTTANNKVANGSGTGAFNGNVTGLPAGTLIYVRAYAINSVNTSYGNEISFTTLSNNADLSGLVLTTATINETFAANTTSYTSSVPNTTSSVTVTATRAQANATIEARVGANAFATITSGSASPSLPLAEGANTINVRVTAQDGTTQKTYTITVTRAAPATIGAQGFTDIGAAFVDTSDINTATQFNIGNLISTGSQSGYFAGLNTQIFGPLTFTVSTPGSFSFGNGNFGSFVATSIIQTQNERGVRSFYISGQFTAGTFKPALSPAPAPASLSISFTQSPAGGGSISNSATLSIPPTPVPTPVPTPIPTPPPTLNPSVTNGSQGFADIGAASVSPGGITTATQFNIGNLISTGSQSGYFAGLSTQIFGPVTFTVSTPGSFSFGNGTFGSFVSTSIVETQNTSGARSFYVLGQFTAGSFNPTLTPAPAPASLLISFTQSPAGSGAISDSATFSIPPAPPPNATALTAPTVTTATQTSVTATSATLGGNVTADGGASVTERGIVWGTATGPTTANNKVANGSGTGAFSATVTGLPAGTTVFVRAYATNSVDTSYGNEISFTTLSNNADLSALALSAGTLSPAFSASIISYSASVPNAMSSITVTATRAETNATLQVNLNRSGFSTLTSGEPSGNLSLDVGENLVEVRVTAQDGITIKTYTTTVTRAAALAVPTVTLPTSSDVTSTSATLGGNVTSDNGAAIIERGVVYSITSVNANPQIGGAGVVQRLSTGTTGIFAVSSGTLLAGTTYSFAAYATNSVGTAYSSVSSFSTLPIVGSVQFESALYSVGQGAISAVITVVRTGGTLPFQVTLATANGTAQTSNPPMSPAIAGTNPATADYVALNATTGLLNFADGENTKTLSLTLHPKSGNNLPSRRFNLSLGSPTAGGVLGTQTSAEVRIVANDGINPLLVVTNPPAATSQFSGLWPLRVTGTAGDLRSGVDAVRVVLNGGAPIVATITNSSNPRSLPWEAEVEPVDGLNSLVVTATDLRGNLLTVTRTFTFTRWFQFSVARTAPAGVSLDQAGSVWLSTSNAQKSNISKLVPPPANANPIHRTVLPGTTLSLEARPQLGYVFSHWEGLPSGAVVLGNEATILTEARDMIITAAFVASPFISSTGEGNTFHGTFGPADPADISIQTTGWLTGTLVPSTGSFSGQLTTGGLTQRFAAVFLGNGSCVFTNAAGFRNGTSLTVGGRALTLSHSPAGIDIRLDGTLVGLAQRARYSSTSPAPASLQGLHTVALPAKYQIPFRDLTTYPQGIGFGSFTTTATGTLIFAGTLADGTAFSASTALVTGEEAPFFAALTTPGASSTLGSFSGLLNFDASQEDSDVTGTDLLWIRPSVTEVLGTRPAPLATQVYTAGWPNGIRVDAVGARYDAARTVQQALNLPDANVESGNVELEFSDGKLSEPVVVSALNIVGNNVTGIPATNSTFSLALVPGTGLMSGVFTPNWTQAAVARPAFRGIVLQKGRSAGGYGFFLSNRANDTDPESGRATLGVRPPPRP